MVQMVGVVLFVIIVVILKDIIEIFSNGGISDGYPRLIFFF